MNGRKIDHLHEKNGLSNYTGEKIISDIVANIGLESYSYEILEEVPGKYGRFDAVILIKSPCETMKNRYIFSIGVEIKSHYSDLRIDTKIPNYLGSTDYMLLWVKKKKSLIELARLKFKDNPYIGLAIQGKEGLEKMPLRQQISGYDHIPNSKLDKGRLNRQKRLFYLQNRRKTRVKPGDSVHPHLLCPMAEGQNAELVV